MAENNILHFLLTHYRCQCFLNLVMFDYLDKLKNPTDLNNEVERVMKKSYSRRRRFWTCEKCSRERERED